MSLERLVEEIRQKAEAEIARERGRLDGERARLATERDRRVTAIRQDAERQAEVEVARERSQRLARAKLEARKRVFEAREKRMGRQLELARTLLTEFTESDEYPALLKRLHAYAVGELGKPLKVSGRAEDAGVLKSVAKANFDDTPQPILGGLIAETGDGARRLNLSFDELLRLREDRVRDLLAS